MVIDMETRNTAFACCENCVYDGLSRSEFPCVNCTDHNLFTPIGQEVDVVNKPPHYTDGKIEVIDFITDKFDIKSFCLGNAIKYISRAGKKNPDKEKEDLQKAIWYINHYIEVIDRE